VLTGRDVLRVGVGTVLLVDAGLVVRSALGGTAGDLEQLVAAGLLVAVAGALAALASDARADGDGGYALVPDEPGPGRGRSLRIGRGRGLGDWRGRRRREPDAHPMRQR
jgi:hypothetical protein